MDASTPRQLLHDAGSNSLLRRLWREHLYRHRGRLVVVLLLTAIMVMNFGQVIATGTPEQVRQDETVLAAYLGASA